jgi:putative adenylate-forming enzyme
VYQCTEGLVAVSCRRGALHVQEDVMVMQTKPISRSDMSSVTPILTDLWRRTQPIIRYGLGDVLRLESAPCPCGSSWQRIAAIDGRQDDLCWFPRADDTLRVVFPDAIRRMILLADERIVEYRAVQPAPGDLDVHISVRDSGEFSDVAARLHHAVRDALATYGCSAVSVTVHEGVPRSEAGAKRRRVIRSWHARGDAQPLIPT